MLSGFDRERSLQLVKFESSGLQQPFALIDVADEQGILEVGAGNDGDLFAGLWNGFEIGPHGFVSLCGSGV